MSNQLKYGLKLKYINSKIICTAIEILEKGYFDYLEIHYDFNLINDNLLLLQTIKEPIVLHAPYFYEGFNISTTSSDNDRIFKEMKLHADLINSKFIVIHPGVGGELSKVIRYLTQYYDPRILVENLPKYTFVNRRDIKSRIPNFFNSIKSISKYIPREFKNKVLRVINKSEIITCIGYLPEEIQIIMNSTKVGFCLDFGHAIKSAIAENRNYFNFIEEYIKLCPKLYHMHDGESNSVYDRHLKLGSGDYDLNFLIDTLDRRNINYITLETPKNNNQFQDDIENVLYLKNLE